MKRYILVVLWLMMVGVPFSASAAVAVTVNIDSQPAVTGNDCVPLSQTGGAGKAYGNLTIAGSGGNDARVGTGCAGTPDDDTTNDGLRLLTAVITSSDTNVEHTITFSGVYTDPPTAQTSTGTQVWYKLSGQGNFKKSSGMAATGASVKAWGSVKASGSLDPTPITSTYLSKTMGVTSNFFGGIILSQLFPSPDIAGARTLQGIFRFTFKNAGDLLQIDNANGIVVYSSGSPGPGTDAGIAVPQPGQPCPVDVTCLPGSKSKTNLPASKGKAKPKK